MNILKRLLLKMGIIKKQVLTEEQNIQEQWYTEAKKMTLDRLPKFIDKLVNYYKHDYGTICRAIVAGMIATGNAMNKSEQGGITGYQASLIMWQFIRVWGNKESPLKLVDYKDMLYPQYVDEFEKIISTKIWKYLQEEANEKLNAIEGANSEVVAHWRCIVEGIVPFGYKVKDDE